MRPVKQAAVVSTHCWVTFAPLALGGMAMVFRFSRDAFLFVSAAMLTYSYRDQIKVHLSSYWRRRTSSVVVPYVVWTVIYFFYRGSSIDTDLPFIHTRWSHLFSAEGLGHFLFILSTGYFQLYFLLVLMQFYVVFPWLHSVLRRRPDLQLRALAIAVLVQVVLSVLVTAQWFGFPVSWYFQSRIVLFYPIYLIGGMVVALRLDEVHDWVVSHKAVIYASTIVAFGLLWLFYELGSQREQVPHFLYTGSEVFSVVAIPYNTLMIAVLYLAGVWLVSARRSLRTKAIVQSGSDNAYGVYLSQDLWLPVLIVLEKSVVPSTPWPLAVIAAVVITYGLGVMFSAVVARTALAKPLVGRSRASWSTLLPRRRLSAASLHEDTGAGPMDVVAE